MMGGTPQEAFIPVLALPKHLLCVREVANSRQCDKAVHTRRAFLALLAAVPLPAHADRTGKYSTKLTAKQRYLPRIARGVELVRAARDGEALEDAAMDDLFTAMQLFATTYFSEGNRVGAKEKELSMLVEQGRNAFSKVRNGGGVAVLVDSVNGFVREAGLAELAGIQEIE